MPPMQSFALPFLLVFLLSLTAFSSGAGGGEATLRALLSIKSSLNDPLDSLRDWDLSAGIARPPWCSWIGVTCSAGDDGDVVALDLSGKNLSGVISLDIRLLSPTLAHLNLSSNAFASPLPPPLLRLRRLLTLDISRNCFNSTFPSAISNLRSLTTLHAYSNCFTGGIPSSLSALQDLATLNLGGSFFSGEVPSSLASLPHLRYFHLAGNLLTGPVPILPNSLEHVEIGYNTFNGGVPPELGGLSELRYLDISSSNLSGSLPPELGNLTGIRFLFLFKNALSGRIPPGFSEMKSIEVLDLSDNFLTGAIPPGFAGLLSLTQLSLMNNNLSGEIPSGIGELPRLESLLLWNNSLSGTLPYTIGSNARLVKLDVSSNSLAGALPPGICTGGKLVRLILFNNRFNSTLPPSIASCSSLWRLRIENNEFTGGILTGFGGLLNLTYVDLSRNRFSGRIPSDISKAPKLQFFKVSDNPLRAPLPANIWRAPSLQVFSASSCELYGGLTGFRHGCRNLYKVEIENNSLSGGVPIDIGECAKLVSLKLGRNMLAGSIPRELAMLSSITEIDLSVNQLTGEVPKTFDTCTTLESLNVSYNRLTGPLLFSSAVLRNLHPSSFAGNEGLCGEIVDKPCNLQEESYWMRHPGKEKTHAATVIAWIAVSAISVGIIAVAVGTRYTREKEKEAWPGQWRLTAFQKLSFRAEDVAESVTKAGRIIGVGSTGAVYRAELPGGEVVAVKKLWAKQKQGEGKPRAGKRHAAGEVEVLGSVRHRNIVRLLGQCSNRQRTLLVYEYMPNGSLEELLHGGGGRKKGEAGVAVDWGTRHRIAMGIAEGMAYLHHDCTPAVLHRDLKPSNILLDAGMEARVADFGLAKLLPHGDARPIVTSVAGSCGYMAPEYAYAPEVDEKSDVYSYGVVVMELVSGRRAVEAGFGEGNNVAQWARERVRKGEEVLDAAIFAVGEETRQEMKLALQVALLCTSGNPSDRPSMRDVVSMLGDARPKGKAKVSGAIAGAAANKKEDN